MSFASKFEAEVYDMLYLMEKGGLLKDLQCQRHVRLTDAEITYIPDFRAFNTETNNVEYFEAKGFETPVWRIKKKLWQYYGPGKLYIYKRSKLGPKLVETVIPRKRKLNGRK